MTGTRILVRKELLESWRTYRLPVVGGLFLLVGLTSPLLARFLPEIIKAAGGDQFGGVQVPTPVPADAVDQLWKNLAQFGAFAAIILAMGAVATERDRGTAAFVLSKTVSRGAFLAAKAIAIGGVLAIAVVLAAVVAWIYTTILFEPMPIGGWVAMAVLAWLGHRGLGGDHVPRQHGHRVRRRGGRARVPGVARPVDRGRRPDPRRGSCRVGSPRPRSRWPAGRRSMPRMS